MKWDKRESRIYEGIADAAVFGLAAYLIWFACFKERDLAVVWFSLKVMGGVTSIWLVGRMLPEMLRLSGERLREELAITLLPPDEFLRRILRRRLILTLLPLAIVFAVLSGLMLFDQRMAIRYLQRSNTMYLQLYGMLASLAAVTFAAQALNMAWQYRLLRQCCRRSHSRGFLVFGPLVWCILMLLAIDQAPMVFNQIYHEGLAMAATQWFPALGSALVFVLVAAGCTLTPLLIALALLRREHRLACRAFYRFDDEPVPADFASVPPVASGPSVTMSS